MGRKAAEKWERRYGEDWRRKRGLLRKARRWPTTFWAAQLALEQLYQWRKHKLAAMLHREPPPPLPKARRHDEVVRVRNRLRDEWRELQRQEGVALKAATRGLLDALRLRPDAPAAS